MKTCDLEDIRKQTPPNLNEVAAMVISIRILYLNYVL